MSVYVAALGIYVAITTFNTLNLEGRYSPDSIFYINAASNLAEGRGLSRSMAELYVLQENEQSLPLPMTQWGPVYPILIALFMKAGFSAAAVALFLSSIGALGVLIAIYALVKRLFDHTTAVCVLPFILFFPPFSLVAQYAWSETLGVTLLLASWRLLLMQDQVRRRQLIALLAAGIIGGLAFATRFALLPLLPFAWIVLIDWKGKPLRLREVATYTAGFALIALPTVARNVYHSGTIGGAPPGSGQGSLAIGALETLQVLWTSFSTTNILVGIVALALLIAALARGFWSPPKGEHTFLGGLVGNSRYSLPLWVSLYLAFLIVAQTRVRVDPIDIRLALPASLMLGVYLISLFAKTVRFPGWIVFPLTYLLIACAILPHFATARNISRVGTLPPYDVQREREKSPLLTWLAITSTPETLFVAEYGLDIPFYIGPTPTAFFSKERKPEADLEYATLFEYLDAVDAWNKYDAVYLLLKPGGSGLTQEVADKGRFYVDLVEGRDQEYGGVRLLERFEDGVVFRLTSTKAP